MSKEYKEVINHYKNLLKQTIHLNDWFHDLNKRYMKIEEQNHYLKFKVSYLEKWIYKHSPKAKLYKDDPSGYDELKKGGNNGI